MVSAPDAEQRLDARQPTAPSSWRRVGSDVLRFDASGISVRNGLRMAVGTTIALAVGYAAGSWASGAAAAGGALSVGVGSVVPSPRPRIAVLTSTAIGMAVGTFVGSATSDLAGLHVPIAFAVAFVCGLLVAVEPAATSVGINSLVGFLVYGRFAAPPLIALRTGGLVAAGGALQVVLVVLVRRRPQVGRGLAGLSRAYGQLAAFATNRTIDSSSLRVAQAIDTADVDIRLSLAVGEAREAWESLVVEARRIRLELLSLVGVRLALDDTGELDAAAAHHVDQFADAVGELLGCLAQGLGTATVPANLKGAVRAVEHAAQPFAKPAGVRRDSGTAPLARLQAAVAALAGQLRAATNLLATAVDVRPGLRGSTAVSSAARVSRWGAHGVRAVLERMRANLSWSSDALQHALRLAVVVTIGTGLAHIAHLDRGYWLALTAVLVLRPEFSITYTRGFGRALGTLVGVGVATAVAVPLHPHGWPLVALVGCFVWLSGALFNASYAVFSVAVTGAVVFLLAGLDTNPASTAEQRLVATVLGAGLALVAYAAWPSWGNRRAADALGDLARTTADYVIAVVRCYLQPDAEEVVRQLGTIGRAVRLARTNAESTVERSLGDPSRRRIDADATAGLLAALRRLAIAGHTLRLQRPHAGWAAPTPALNGLLRGLSGELDAVAAQLRFGRVTRVHEDLRAAHGRLADALRARGDTASLVLVAETDELVDAANTLRELLLEHPPAAG